MPSTLGTVASHRSAVTSAWTPAALPNLRGWYDADDASTFTYSSGTVVSQWRDKSGNAKHAVQATAGLQPNRNGIQNLRACVTFDGVDDILQATGVFSTPTWDAANPHSVIVVAKNTNTAGGGFKTAWGADETRAFRNDPGTNAVVYGGGGIIDSSVSWASTLIVATRHTGSLSTSGISVNGGAWTTGNVGVGAGTMLSIGGRQQGGERWGGTICEVVAMSSTITDTDYAKLVTYLMAKWITPPAPIPLTGMVGWWDASTLALADGAEVATWPDKSGTGQTLTKVGTGPIFKTNIQNGKAVVRHDGTVDRIVRAASAGQYNQFFVVAKYNLAQFGAWAGLLSGSSDNAIIFTGSEGNTIWYNLFAGYYKNGVLTDPPTGPMQAWAVMSAESAGAWLSVTLQVGNDRLNSERPWNGDVGEILAYNRVLSTVERQQVEQYLTNKWFPFHPLTSIPWHAAYWASDPAWTPPANGAAVTTWRDGSGNGRTMTAVGAPVYRAASTLNSKPAVEISANNGLRSAAFTVPAGWEVFVVFKTSATTGEGYIVSAGTPTTYGNSFGKYGGNWAMSGNSGGANGSFSDGPVVAGAHSARALWAPPLNARMVVDGVVVAPNGGPNDVGEAATTWNIGSGKYDSHSFNWPAEVAFVGFKATPLTVQEAASLEAWAKTFYGTP